MSVHVRVRAPSPIQASFWFICVQVLLGRLTARSSRRMQIRASSPVFSNTTLDELLFALPLFLVIPTSFKPIHSTSRCCLEHRERSGEYFSQRSSQFPHDLRVSVFRFCGVTFASKGFAFELFSYFPFHLLG